jgi:hypothetical protein
MRVDSDRVSLFNALKLMLVSFGKCELTPVVGVDVELDIVLPQDLSQRV